MKSPESQLGKSSMAAYRNLLTYGTGSVRNWSDHSEITGNKRCGGRVKIFQNSKLNVMNATLSQNVVVISYNEVPPTNITERVQLKFKVDIHYILYSYITYR